ncbi:peptidase M20 domain-containing protein 2-like [Ixodes scapularis]
MDVYAETVKSAIQERACSLNALGKFVFENPELQFEEHKAHHFIANYLEQEGFLVQRKYILETAFRAEYGLGGGSPVVVLLCEYDALPNIGHACGHHLIAESAVAAGIGVKEVLQRDSSLPGKVVVLGTPAEEAGHGKAYLIDGGAFEGADVAMMIHPAPVNIAVFPSLALATLRVEYRGKESHSGATPWEGINALDAAVGAYVNLSMLRQQMKPSWKLGGMRFPDTSRFPAMIGASTDAGNVSHILPLIHPTFRLNTKAINHTAEFADAARVQTSYELTLKAAQALSLTALEVIRDPKLLKKVKDEFQENQTQK